MKKGLLIGRFQPFHLGHLSAVRQAFSQCEFLIIGIGSSQYSGTQNDPLTAEARITIIQTSLKEAGINEDRYQITLIPDIHNNDNWVTHVKKLVRSFDILFIANEGINTTKKRNSPIWHRDTKKDCRRKKLARVCRQIGSAAHH
jgi:nicotinamide-nucleotide adenylyltransferase